MADDNRLARVRISADAIIKLFQQSLKVPIFSLVEDALPFDAKFVRWGIGDSGNFFIIISSSAFDEVKEDEIIPEIPAPKFFLHRYMLPSDEADRTKAQGIAAVVQP